MVRILKAFCVRTSISPAWQTSVYQRLMALVTVLPMAACTSLNVHKLTNTSPDNEREGIAYYLPIKQLKVDLTFRLTDCRVEVSEAKLSFVTTAKVQEAQLPDLSERYTISYRELSAITKTTDLTVVTSELGLLVSVNAKVTDQTGPILASLASAGFSVGRGSALKALWNQTLSSSTESKTLPIAKNPCEKFDPKLKAVKDATAALDSAVEQDEQRAIAVTARNKAAVALKIIETILKEATEAKDHAAEKDAQAKLPKIKAEFAVLHESLEKLGPAQTTLKTNALNEALAAVSVNRTVFWAPNQDSYVNGKIKKEVTPSITSFENLGFDNASAKIAASQLAATLQLLPIGHQGQLKDATLPPKAGIVYRQPAHLMLQIASKSGTENPAPEQYQSDEFAYAGVHAFPQFGAKASLPLSNGLFEDNGLAVSFGESGQPKSVTFNSKSSAERAAGSAKSIAADYLGFINGRQSDQLELRKSLREDAEGDLALETKRRDARLDTLDDRLEILKKYQLLETVRAGTGSRDQILEDALSARKRQLQLQIDIKEQENKLKALGATTK